MENRSLGYTYAIIAQFFFVLWSVFVPLSFSYYNLPTIFSLWFGTATIMSFLYILFSGRIKEYSMLKTHWKPILLSTAFNTGSVATGFYALRLLGPSLNGFLVKIGMVVLILFGVLFLKEKFSKLEVINGLIIILGTFIISFSTGNFVFKGILFILIHSIFYSTARYIVKSKLHDISPLFISHYRVTMIAIYMFAFAYLSGQFEFYISKGLLFVTLPSIFPAVIGHIFIFKAYKIMEISKIELISALNPFLVVITSFLVFKEVLSLNQYVGGTIIIFGIIWLVYMKNNIQINGSISNFKNKLINNKITKK